MLRAGFWRMLRSIGKLRPTADAGRGLIRRFWADMVQKWAGTGVLVPEGQVVHMGHRAAGILAEEMGRVPWPPRPNISTAVIAASILRQGRADARGMFARPIAEGKPPILWHWTRGRVCACPPTANARHYAGNAFRLSGAKALLQMAALRPCACTGAHLGRGRGNCRTYPVLISTSTARGLTVAPFVQLIDSRESNARLVFDGVVANGDDMSVIWTTVLAAAAPGLEAGKRPLR